jgi:nitroreductase
MDFMEIVRKRYSVRKYTEEPVGDDLLALILEAGRLAPTGANYQPQRLIVIRQKDGLERLKKGANVYGAPLAILICADHDDVWKRRYDGKTLTDIDTSIVTTHMMLEATELGLGTLWVCHFDPEIVRTEFGLPAHLEPVHILAVGYAHEKAREVRPRTTRKPMEETVWYERYEVKAAE